MVNTNKVLYLLILLLFPAMVFAQTDQTKKSFIEQVAEQLIPKGYYLLAEGFGIPRIGALVIFFLVWLLVAGFVWAGIQRALAGGYTITDNKGYAIFAISLGGLVAYAIGLWGVTFVIMLIIIALLLVGYALVVAGETVYGRYLLARKKIMELEKDIKRTEKDFLKVDHELKRLKEDYNLLNSILSSEHKWVDVQSKILPASINYLIEDYKNAIHTGDLNSIKKVLIETEKLKKELEYIENVLPEDDRVKRIINILKDNLNSIKDRLKRAIKRELETIEGLEVYVRSTVDEFENKLGEIDKEIIEIKNEIEKAKQEISRMRNNLYNLVREKKINELIRELNGHIKDLTDNIEKLKEKVEEYIREFNSLEKRIMNLGRIGRYIAQELDTLKQEFKKCRQEFENEYKNFISRKSQVSQVLEDLQKKGSQNKEKYGELPTIKLYNCLSGIGTSLYKLLEIHENIRRQLERYKTELLARLEDYKRILEEFT